MEPFIDQPVLTRYNDQQSEGSWSLTIPKNCGIMKPGKHGGNVWSRTVKFLGDNSVIQLGKEYFHKDQ